MHKLLTCHHVMKLRHVYLIQLSNTDRQLRNDTVFPHKRK